MLKIFLEPSNKVEIIERVVKIVIKNWSNGEVII